MGWQDDHILVADAVEGMRPSEGGKGWLRANCPLCDLRVGTPDRKRSLGVNAYTLRFECYRCGVYGKLRQRPEDMPEPPERPEDEPLPPIERPPEFVELATRTAQTSISLAPAVKYITEERGLDMGIVEQVGIGACATGRYRSRVVIPLIGQDGSWAWLVARRWVKKAERPYLYPVGDRGGTMFNQSVLHIDTDRPAMVVEGCFDAIAYWPDAVAILGSPTPAILEGLLCSRRPLAVVLDGDAADKGWALSMSLRLAGKSAGNVRLPVGPDPDELPRQKVWRAAEKCINRGEVTL